VRGVALHGLHEVRDEVMPPLQLHVDVGVGLVHALPQRDQAVVRGDQEERDQDEDDQHDKDFHLFLPLLSFL
jgi:hypothetical protein